MSNTNANVRSLRDKFQQQQANEYANSTKSRQEQQPQEFSFQCVQCGTHQIVTLLLQSNITKDVPRSSSRDYDSNFQSRNNEQENKSFAILRQVSAISEESNELTSPLYRSNYASDFRSTDDGNNSKLTLERNMKGFVDGCVRSSIHEVSHGNRQPETQDIVEVEVEYDTLLGNVTATRKRSSTIITSLDNDYRSAGYRNQSVNSRHQAITSDSQRDDGPIWARRRTSHSTVKPSDLVREHDKKEKLEPNALRRLSRTDLLDDSVIPNSTIKSTNSTQNPAMIKDTILRWCQDLTQFYKGVNIRNFSSSWSDGLAFCAIIHRYFPDEFNFDTLYANEPRQNFDLAFTVALERAGIDPLIDTDDMLFMGNKPDWKVVFTYVQSLYRHLSRLQPASIMRERW